MSQNFVSQADIGPLFSWDRKQSEKMNLHFDGTAYEPKYDKKRLTGQCLRIWDTMVNGEWLTLSMISEQTGAPEASISATLRDFRKIRFGEHIVNKRRKGNKYRGLWEYQLVIRR